MHTHCLTWSLLYISKETFYCELLLSILRSLIVHLSSFILFLENTHPLFLFSKIKHISKSLTKSQTNQYSLWCSLEMVCIGCNCISKWQTNQCGFRVGLEMVWIDCICMEVLVCSFCVHRTEHPPTCPHFHKQRSSYAQR